MIQIKFIYKFLVTKQPQFTFIKTPFCEQGQKTRAAFYIYKDITVNITSKKIKINSCFSSRYIHSISFKKILLFYFTLLMEAAFQGVNDNSNNYILCKMFLIFFFFSNQFQNLFHFINYIKQTFKDGFYFFKLKQMFQI